ncbi:MAG TPA: hypothetical protein VF556_10240 [Pyrinomonadaceae bacterium]|jgi:hypothetical protein
MNGKIENLISQVKADTEEKTSIASANKVFENDAEAEREFQRLSENLKRIEQWNQFSGASSFGLFDENGGKIPDRPAAIGDFVCIKLPATGKADWVKIVDIYEGEREKILTVRPTYNPTDESNDKNVTSHFFTSDSTNNFCLQLKRNEVNMHVIGLNEISNTEATNNIIESARNLATANLGHFLGVQKAEWTTFCENFLKSEN